MTKLIIYYNHVQQLYQIGTSYSRLTVQNPHEEKQSELIDEVFYSKDWLFKTHMKIEKQSELTDEGILQQNYYYRDHQVIIKIKSNLLHL